MPKVSRRSQRCRFNGAASNGSRTDGARGKARTNAQYKKVRIEHNKLVILYEHRKDDDGHASFTRLHISRQGAFGPPPPRPPRPPRAPVTTAGNNQQQNGHQATTVVINNDHGGIALDVSSRKNEHNSLDITITNGDS